MRRSDNSRKPWLGGYIRPGKRGPTFVIERWIDGEHFHISTRRRTERAAIRELERFEQDPAGYEPLADVEDESAVTITIELVTEYRDFCLKRLKNERQWVNSKVAQLGHWAEDLGGKDLRTVSIQRDIKPALDRRKTSRKHRIEALKHFCAWLREEKGLMARHEDRTLDLPVPVDEPAKFRKRKVVSKENVFLTEVWLPDRTRDVLALQLATAWHITEVRRFARSGEIVRPPSGAPLAVLLTPHKSGGFTRTPITEVEHLRTAERLRAKGKIPCEWSLARDMMEACEKVRKRQLEAGTPEKDLMPHWRLGQMRHTVLTWAVEMGATPEQAAQFANHRSVETTRRFYLDLAVPTVSVPVLRLVSGKG